jgi:hypothetical protein
MVKQQRKNFDYIVNGKLWLNFLFLFLFTLLFYHWWLGQIKSEEPRDPSFWETPLQRPKLHNPDFAPQFKNQIFSICIFPSLQPRTTALFPLWIAFHMSPSFWEKRKRKRIYIIKVFRWQFHAQNSSTLILSSLSLWEKIQLKKLKKMAGVGQFPRLCTVTWLNKQSPYLLLQWIMIAYKTSWHYCTMRPVFDS